MKQLMTFSPEPFPELDEEAPALGLDTSEYEWLGEAEDEEFGDFEAAQWGDELTDYEAGRRRPSRRPASRGSGRRQPASRPATGPTRRASTHPQQVRRITAKPWPALQPNVRPGLRPAPGAPWPPLRWPLGPRPLPVIPLLPVGVRVPPRIDIAPPPPRSIDADGDRRDDANGSSSAGPPPTPTPEPTATEYGRWVQDCLNRSLGLTLAVDGLMNAETRSAIRLFQQRQGLASTGLIGPDTEAALQAACAATTLPADASAADQLPQSELAHPVFCTCPACLGKNTRRYQLTFEAEPFPEITGLDELETFDREAAGIWESESSKEMPFCFYNPVGDCVTLWGTDPKDAISPWKLRNWQNPKVAIFRMRYIGPGHCKCRTIFEGTF